MTFFTPFLLNDWFDMKLTLSFYKNVNLKCAAQAICCMPLTFLLLLRVLHFCLFFYLGLNQDFCLIFCFYIISQHCFSHVFTSSGERIVGIFCIHINVTNFCDFSLVQKQIEAKGSNNFSHDFWNFRFFFLLFHSLVTWFALFLSLDFVMRIAPFLSPSLLSLVILVQFLAVDQ